MNSKQLMNKAADNIRILTAAMVEKAKSGHPGGAMGGADFINVLYSEFLVHDPDNPLWEGRDRFFLDPGHMSPMLYSVLALSDKYTIKDLTFDREWNVDEMYEFVRAGGSVMAEFNELPVKKITFKINSSKPIAISDVVVLGKTETKRHRDSFSYHLRIPRVNAKAY